MTIIEAVTQVMMAAGKPMTPKDVLSEIERANLYEFKTKDRLGVIRAQMRRHCDKYDKPTAATVRSLRMSGKDTYILLDDRGAPR